MRNESEHIIEFFKMSIAGLRIEVECHYRKVFNLCGQYLAHFECPDFVISTTMEEIEAEQDRITEIDDAQQKKQIAKASDYLETLAVYRKIAEKVIDYDIFLMHGAAIALNGEAYLFIAKSGTGKTTHIKKWLENRPDCIVVNGDKPLIRITEQKILVCGTPWCGKEKLGTNTMVPLKAVIFMERNEENTMEAVSFMDILPKLIAQTYMPGDTEKRQKTIALLYQLKDYVRFYHFRFNNMREDAFSVAYHTLTGE